MYPCCEGGPGIIAKVHVRTYQLTLGSKGTYQEEEVPEGALGEQRAVESQIVETGLRWSMNSFHRTEERAHNE